MRSHGHFEELCVLATSGQLAAAESDILNRHLVECDSCRSFLRHAQFISDRILPQTLYTVRAETRVPAGMRERFLARAASEGLDMQAGPPAAVALLAAPELPPPRDVQSRLVPTATRVLAGLSLQSWTIVGGVGLACFVLGLVVRTASVAAWRHNPGGSALTAPSRLAKPAGNPVNADAERLRALATEHDQLARQVRELTQQLQTVRNEKQQTESALQQQLAATQTAAAHDHDDLIQQAMVENERAADLDAQLESTRKQESLAVADLQSARAKTSEYASRLDLMQMRFRDEETTPLPVANQVSSLVAARNLHIVDVYDSNPDGKRRRAFGRLFYVEGRSLVFYAYDLPVAHAQKKISFHLWGAKVGDTELTLNLGVLHDDDPRDRRWTVTCSDPALLAKINSVYVTAESAGKPDNAPHGPRVLYAYFGTPPNHP